MEGFETGSAELKTAAQQMETANADLQGQLAQLAGSVEGIAGHWRGQAATAFGTLMHRFAEDADKLNKALNSIAEQVAGSATAYEAQEAQAQQSLSQITNTLGG
jgi:WXG100 family type VII secretion target